MLGVVLNFLVKLGLGFFAPVVYKAALKIGEQEHERDVIAFPRHLEYSNCSWLDFVRLGFRGLFGGLAAQDLRSESLYESRFAYIIEKL